MNRLQLMMSLLLFTLGAVSPLSGPAKVTWEVTHRCNSRCRHCHLWQVSDHSADLSTEEAKVLIRDVARLGTLHLSFSGGEPFLRPDMHELASYARECGMSTAVNTNGSRLGTPEQAKRACDSGLGTVFISLDSCKPEVHNAIRGHERAYDSVARAIDCVLSQRSGESPKVFINTTVNRENYDDLEDILALAKRLGVDGMTMSIIQDIGKYSPENAFRFGPDGLDSLTDRLCRLAEDSEGLIPHSADYLRHFETYLTKPKALYKYRCVAGYATALVHPNGDVHACPVAFAPMGNVRESSFRDLWFSDQANEVRQRIKMNRHPICWFDCVAPFSVLMHNVHSLRLDKALHRRTLSHILAKVRR